MKRKRKVMLFLLLPLLAPGLLLPLGALEPHPDAVPNSHAPGEVDVEANLPFIVPEKDVLEGIVLDETDATLTGEWQYSTHTPPYVGIGYLHDRKSGKGEKSVTWTPDFPAAGEYEVRISHCYNVRRATNALIVIEHAGGTARIRINQQEVPEHSRLFRSLGTFRFLKGPTGSLSIRNDGTSESKVVIADAVQFIRKPDNDASESRD